MTYDFREDETLYKKVNPEDMPEYEDVYNFAKQEWEYNTGSKYKKYFDDWFKNINYLQFLYWRGWMHGNKTIWCDGQL